MKPNSSKVKESYRNRLESIGIDPETMIAQDYWLAKKHLKWSETTFRNALRLFGRNEEAKEFACPDKVNDYIPTDDEVMIVEEYLGAFGKALTYIGCRFAEMWTLRIDGDHLVVNPQKGGEPVTIDLTEVPAKYVSAIAEWVAAAPKTSQRQIRYAWSKLQKDGSLNEKCVPHSFRHRLISRAIEAGESVETAGKMVGHKSLNTTYRYYHKSPKRQSNLRNQILLP